MTPDGSTRSNDPPQTAEEAFARYMSLRSAGDAPSLEAWLSDHPRWRDELREMHADEHELMGNLRSLATHVDASPRASHCSGGACTTSATSIAAGATLADFRLIERIAGGSQGEVWEAEQLSIEKRVALKLLHPHLLTTVTLRFFEKEAKAAARIHHHGIVDVFSTGEAAGVHFIAEELVEGGRTLRHFLDDMRELAELPASYYPDVARLFLELAQALQAAHDAGVLHRDLKPQNILLTPAGRPKVTDFGLARIQGEQSLLGSGDIVGTYRYMSPEQLAARPKDIDPRTDIFSLGVVLYEALTLTRPFEGDSSHQIAHKILSEDPPNAMVVRSRVPWDLATACGKCIEKRPSLRYASMRALAEDLRRHLDHEPILARPPGLWLRLSKLVSRHPVFSAALGCAAVATCAITALLFENVRARRSAEDNQHVALARTNEVLSLSAVQDLQDLIDRADGLWPVDPSLVPRCEAWLRDAEALVRGDERTPGLAGHREKLAVLQARAVPSSDTYPGGARRLDERQDWPSGSREDRWWNAQLQKLVADLESFTAPATGLFSPEGVSRAHGWSVAKRLAIAREIDSRSVSGAQARERWSRAIASIADEKVCPAYHGLTIGPQLGLLPIGRDEHSGLWEFAHLSSGTAAERDREGNLLIGEENGIVLVLVPGARFWMGAQKSDRGAPNFDSRADPREGPVREVELAPYFLAKHEMTQAQWLRMTGANPSQGNAGKEESGKVITWMHCVENVSWNDGRRVLQRVGLDFPTEAQWEMAARAGTSAPWWTGDDPRGLSGSVNLADRQLRQHGGPENWDYDDWLDDGFVVHAPVNALMPNPFGFHNTIGNVWEWCRDLYGGYELPARAGDGEREVTEGDSRVYRGGAFTNVALASRCSTRGHAMAEFLDYDIGLRPCRSVLK